MVWQPADWSGSFKKRLRIGIGGKEGPVAATSFCTTAEDVLYGLDMASPRRAEVECGELQLQTAGPRRAREQVAVEDRVVAAVSVRRRQGGVV
jgi:hypothetical protein